MISLPMLIALAATPIDPTDRIIADCSVTLAQSWKQAQANLPKSANFEGGFELLMTTKIGAKDAEARMFDLKREADAFFRTNRSTYIGIYTSLVVSEPTPLAAWQNATASQFLPVCALAVSHRVTRLKFGAYRNWGEMPVYYGIWEVEYPLSVVPRSIPPK